MQKAQRRYICVSVLVLLVLMIVVLFQGKQDSVMTTKEDITEMLPNEKDQDKTLVAYFSAIGNTLSIAETIAEILQSDIYAITPLYPYTTEDLDYTNPSSRSSLEQGDVQSRPAISGSVDNMETYDVIYLGYPLWHEKVPAIIATFLESYAFSGKTIIPFCTSHSSDMQSSEEALHALSDASVKWMSGKRFLKQTTQQEIQAWLNSIEGHNVSTFDVTQGDKLLAPTVTLNSGYEMPIVGLGTYSLFDDTCINAVLSALESGYRLIDTAYIYENEEEVGQAIKQSNIPREELFITTKLYPNQFANAKVAIQEALDTFDLEYIDLMLLHHPGENDVAAYKAMEKAVEEGKIHSIGLSNWYIEEMETFLPQITITPALVQNEIHPFYQENAVIEYMHAKGIVMEGWYPLGGRGHTQEMLGNETIQKIAKRHAKSAAQVILRWNLQKGVIVIPGSSNPDHIRENITIFDFELTDEEMKEMNALDRNEKHDWY